MALGGGIADPYLPLENGNIRGKIVNQKEGYTQTCKLSIFTYIFWKKCGFLKPWLLVGHVLVCLLCWYVQRYVDITQTCSLWDKIKRSRKTLPCSSANDTGFSSASSHAAWLRKVLHKVYKVFWVTPCITRRRFPTCIELLGSHWLGLVGQFFSV